MAALLASPGTSPTAVLAQLTVAELLVALLRHAKAYRGKKRQAVT